MPTHLCDVLLPLRPIPPNQETPVRSPWTVRGSVTAFSTRRSLLSHSLCSRSVLAFPPRPRSILAVVFLTTAGLTVPSLPAEAQTTATAPQTAPSTVRPGPPGAPTRSLDASELRAPTRAQHTEADVSFMQDMILHHRQALVMSEMVPERSARRDVRALAERIERSQDAEIAFMERWLELRGESGPDGDHHHHHGHHGPPGDPGDHHHGHHDHDAQAEGDHRPMAGMLTEAELAELAAAQGEEFDRLFLTFMIMHHEGALIMVDELFDSPGAVLDTDIFDLASHILADQVMEIARMRRMLDGEG